MDNSNVEIPRKLNEWLSKEEHDKWREEFVTTGRKDYLETINSSDLFNDLNPREKGSASILLARFSFGVTNVLRRYGYKNNVFNIPLQFTENENVGGLATVLYREEGGKKAIGIFMRPDWLRKLVRFAEKGEFAEKLFYDYYTARHNPYPDPGDFFEISGVEEAAHYLLLQEKGDIHYRSHFQAESYWSSDAEYQALMWQLAYTKRYFPDYYEKLQEEKPWADHWRQAAIVFDNLMKK